MNRRAFFQRVAGGTVAATLAPKLVAAQSSAPVNDGGCELRHVTVRLVDSSGQELPIADWDVFPRIRHIERPTWLSNR